MGLTLKVRCTYCHDALEPSGSVYCAGCLAPYHGDCFLGRCGALGCGEDHLLRPEPAPRRPSVLRPLLGATVFALVLPLMYLTGRAYAHAQAQTHQAILARELIPVLVANRDLPAGTVLSEGHLEVANFERSLLEPILRSTWIKEHDRNEVVGAQLATPVKAGMVLLESHFAPKATAR